MRITHRFPHFCSTKFAGAGYASDRKVADLTCRWSWTGKLEEFKQKAEAFSGLSYEELIKQPTLLIPVASALAHEYYPKIWSTTEAFRTTQSISTVNDQDRVRQMLELIENKAGTRRVLFIGRRSRSLPEKQREPYSQLDGLARNLKEIGQGQAWLIATASTNDTQDRPLFGLQDRFPIKIDLKASDIREITHNACSKERRW